MPFLIDAATSNPSRFLGGGKVGEPFGVNREAYVRPCYEDLTEEIDKEIDKWHEGDTMRIVEIRGSAGIGKSAFLAYTIAKIRENSEMENFAIFHSGNDVDMPDIDFSVWIGGELVMDKEIYGNKVALKKFIGEYLPKLGAIFMDGCSTTFDLSSFTGMIFVAAPPSVKTSHFKREMSAKRTFATLYMPCWSREEVEALGRLLGEDKSVIADNFKYMPGIVRYMFTKGSAKSQVEDSASVANPTLISNMVATQHTDKDVTKSMVHSLVCWMPMMKDGKIDYRAKVHYKLVSRFAERLVAEKLYISESEELNKTRRSLTALSGAESYAGALFEAYAIREFLRGGEFHVRNLEGGSNHEIVVPEIPNPVVVECNTLDTVAVNEVHKKATNGSWVPQLLWPPTTNFPTFDAYYFHTDGEVYALQMTIALTHQLKNSGAFQTKEYLKKIETATAPYKAVFVVPSNRVTYKKQKFTGRVTKGENVLFSEAEASALMNKQFQQWAIDLD